MLMLKYLKDYYCWPTPELDTLTIKKYLNNLTDDEFIDWVFNATNSSSYFTNVPNLWHKNNWTIDKFKLIAKEFGFSFKVSDFGNHLGYWLPGNVEKRGYKREALYVEFIK